MEFLLLNGENTIGEVSIVGTDPGMGIVLGTFSPSAGYEEVRSVFELYTNAVSEDEYQSYYRKRNALPLKFTTASGETVATERIHIVEISRGSGAEEYEVQITVDSPETLSRFFEEWSEWSES